MEKHLKNYIYIHKESRMALLSAEAKINVHKKTNIFNSIYI